MFGKFKSLLVSDKGFYATLLLLVGLVAYSLGQAAGGLNGAAVNPSSQPAIVFTAAPAIVIPADAVPVVASRGGTKYHRLDCPGAQTIKEANLIRFASTDLARAAGYLPAGNCRGLD